MRPFLLAAALAASVPAARAEEPVAGPALRPEWLVSSDSDGNHSVRASLGWDVSRRDLEHWWGVRAERLRYAGPGWREVDERLFLRAAGGEGGWRWQGEVGSDGHDLLGSASVHSTGRWRQEYFLERDVLETELGAAEGRVHTFAGAALDMPLGERATATVLAGLQDFGARNLRRHLRATLAWTALPEAGLSLQLRARQFHDSDPGEAGYFAPGRYRQWLGVASMRRFTEGGHQWRLTAGLGRQHIGDGPSQRARLFELDVRTRASGRHYLRATAGYSDAPGNQAAGPGYDYRYVRVEAVWAL